MKKSFKFYSLILVFAILISCFPITTNARTLNDVVIDLEIPTDPDEATDVEEVVTDTEILTEEVEIARCTSGMSETLSTLMELEREAECTEELIQTLQKYSKNKRTSNIQIDEVQIFRNISDLEEDVQVPAIEIKDGMIAKVFYDDGESWIEYFINPPLDDNSNTNSSINSTTTNSQGNPNNFALPLDNMNLTTHITCRFNCERNGVLCSWCVRNN